MRDKKQKNNKHIKLNLEIQRKNQEKNSKKHCKQKEKGSYKKKK